MAQNWPDQTLRLRYGYNEPGAAKLANGSCATLRPREKKTQKPAGLRIMTCKKNEQQRYIILLRNNSWLGARYDRIAAQPQSQYKTGTQQRTEKAAYREKSR